MFLRSMSAKSLEKTATFEETFSIKVLTEKLVNPS